MTRALERDRRRRLALADVEILTRTGGSHDPDHLDGLAEYGARLPIDPT